MSHFWLQFSDPRKKYLSEHRLRYVNQTNKLNISETVCCAEERYPANLMADQRAHSTGQVHLVGVECVLQPDAQCMGKQLFFKH